MKKLLGLALAGTAVATAMTGCGSADTTINVYTRDTTSGTREGFFGAIGAGEAKETNDYLIEGVSEVTGNGDMMSKVKGDVNGIGYISLTSLEDSGLKGLNFEGKEATEANVISGDYGMSRDFGYTTLTTHTDAQVQGLVEQWNLFLDSTDGEAALTSAGVIVTPTASAGYTADTTFCTGVETDILIGGSTSVEGAATALTDAFSAACSAFNGVHAHTGSSASEAVMNNSTEMHIGFSSSGVRSGWDTGNVKGTLGKDAIVAVVHKDNKIDNLTEKQLQEIFIKVGAKDEDGEAVAANTTNITDWAELA